MPLNGIAIGILGGLDQAIYCAGVLQITNLVKLPKPWFGSRGENGLPRLKPHSST
jgi:hypothetical protein